MRDRESGSRHHGVHSSDGDSDEPIAMTEDKGQGAKDRLLQDGFCRFENVLPDEMLHRLRAATDELLAALTDEKRQQLGGQGSMVGMPYLPAVFSELIAWPAAIGALQAMGFKRPRYWSAYIIAKEAHSPASYWHQDWPYWDDPVSAEAEPHQLFLMYYLTDTRPENGCLRAIPGSHRRWFPQHDMGGHDAGTRHADPETSPAYADSPGQADISVKAGDLLVGDARILHAPHGNQTAERRTVITLWYLPRFDELPETMQATFQQVLYMIPPKSLPSDLMTPIAPLLLDYEGDCEPVTWNRQPGKYIDGAPAD